MARAGEHIKRVIAHLQEHGRTQSSVLCTELGIEPGVLIAAVRLSVERGEVTKEKEGRCVFYALGDGAPLEQEEGAEESEIRWAWWDDGDIVMYGLVENEDGSHTIPAAVLGEIRKRIAWGPLA